MKLLKLNLDLISRNFLLLALLFTAAQTALLIKYLADLPPQVSLFYSLPWGSIRLAEPVWLWLLPSLSLGSLIFNLVGAHLSNDLALTRILSGTAWLVSVLALVTLTKIIILGLP